MGTVFGYFLWYIVGVSARVRCFRRDAADGTFRRGGPHAASVVVPPKTDAFARVVGARVDQKRPLVGMGALSPPLSSPAYRLWALLRRLQCTGCPTLAITVFELVL